MTTKPTRDQKGRFTGSTGAPKPPTAAPKPPGCPVGTKHRENTRRREDMKQDRARVLDEVRRLCAETGTLLPDAPRAGRPPTTLTDAGEGRTLANAHHISQRLRERGHDIAPSTVRRHLAALIAEGQLVRGAKRMEGERGQWTRNALSIPERVLTAALVQAEAERIKERHRKWENDPLRAKRLKKAEERRQRGEKVATTGHPATAEREKLPPEVVAVLDREPTISEMLAAERRPGGPLR